ncbi:MAG TPA: bifunctional precorrin-2 dehydrogenase/sirohydrochlorin ferrochelatase [Acidimicrobiia bacterium]|nr:bifunctional precorrin-2 dehydrogenase/sirohydrochlorin ferrochelatase [Acidimicrobiia bacterium]
MPFRYPVALELSGRRCVVTGGGREAEGKARALLEAEADVVVIAPRVSNGLGDLVRRGEVTHIARRYRRGDIAGAFLVIAADSDRAVRAAVFAEAEAERVLCNAVDDVEHCHFAVPSIVRRGELLLAISTGGRVPALAKRLRRRLTEQFGWQWEALVDVLGEVRAETQPTRTGDFATWAARWQSVLDREDELLRLLEEGRIAEVRARVYAALKPATTSAHCSGSVR